MTFSELKKEIKEIKRKLKEQPRNKDKTDDELDKMILNGFFNAYMDGKMSKSDLAAIAKTLGYELTSDFDDEAPKQIK